MVRFAALFVQLCVIDTGAKEVISDSQRAAQFTNSTPETEVRALISAADSDPCGSSPCSDSGAPTPALKSSASSLRGSWILQTANRTSSTGTESVQTTSSPGAGSRRLESRRRTGTVRVPGPSGSSGSGGTDQSMDWDSWCTKHPCDKDCFDLFEHQQESCDEFCEKEPCDYDCSRDSTGGLDADEYKRKGCDTTPEWVKSVLFLGVLVCLCCCAAACIKKVCCSKSSDS